MPTGSLLTGYYEERIGKKKQDVLYAQAIAFAQGSARGAFGAGLSGNSSEWRDALRKRVVGTGLYAAAVFIAFAHTHTSSEINRQRP